MSLIGRFKSLPVSSKRLLGLGVVVAMVVALPLFIWAIITLNFNPFKKAASGEPVGNPINWTSGSISITADNFYVISNGERYDGNSNITVNPGPSGPSAEGIEIVSNANGNNLKLQMMFRKDSNNYSWWVDHVYYGNNKYTSDSSNFTGIFFKSVIGSSFQDPGDITMLVRNPSNNQVVAELHYTNLRIQGFVGQTPPPTACPPQPLKIQVAGGVGQTGINQKYRLSFGVYRSDVTCLGNLTVNLSARLPDGWTASFEHPSFSLASNANFYTTVDITPTTFNVINEPIIIYATTVYPQSTDFRRIYITVGQTPQPLPTPPYPNYCPRSCTGNHDCSYMLDCIQGFCKNPSCLSSTNCICGPTPPPASPSATAIPTSTPNNYCTGPNGSGCSINNCPVCTGGICPQYCGAPTLGTCQNNVCIPSPTPSPTPLNWCQNNGSACTYLDTANCPTLPPCTPGPNIICPSISCPTKPGVCQNNTCVPPQQVTRSFGILFKFEGVSDGSAEGAKVTVKYMNPTWNAVSYETPPIRAGYVAGGVYLLSFSIPPGNTTMPVSNSYSIILKGEKHQQVKFCFPSGQTSHCAASTTGNITIPDSANLISLNFSGIPLPPGDTYPQDGIINYFDFGRINAALSKPYSSQTGQDKLSADLDYNGRVDIRDMFLFRKGLETKYDEY